MLTKKSRTFFQPDSIDSQKDMSIPSNAVHIEVVILLDGPAMGSCITDLNDLSVLLDIHLMAFEVLKRP